MSFEEISERLDITRDRVEQIYLQAMRKIKRNQRGVRILRDYKEVAETTKNNTDFQF